MMDVGCLTGICVWLSGSFGDPRANNDVVIDRNSLRCVFGGRSQSTTAPEKTDVVFASNAQEHQLLDTPTSLLNNRDEKGTGGDIETGMSEGRRAPSLGDGCKT